MNLYLKAGLAARAAQVLMNVCTMVSCVDMSCTYYIIPYHTHNLCQDVSLQRSTDVVERVASVLTKAGLYPILGSLYEQVRKQVKVYVVLVGRVVDYLAA